MKALTIKKWKCVVCGLIVEGEEPPEICPACGAGKDQFIEVIEAEVGFTSDSRVRIIIIGNGAAGYYAAETARKKNQNCSIKMISSESYNSYYRPSLSDLLSKTLRDEEFFIADENWYAENNVELLLNTQVTRIEPSSKKVYVKHSENSEEISYDKLILANGSNNFILPISGYDKQGVFTLRSKKDADNIVEYMKNAKKAVIIGGGLLGLEAAWEMKKSGLDVTVVEFENMLLAKQLDKSGSEIVFKASAAAGVNILLGESAEEIFGDEQVTGVKLRSGKILPCDLVLFSVGIRPNIALGKAAGLDYNRGIIVNNKMETSIKDIYSCGDVAEFNKIVYGNWPAATDMGKVAGANAVGDTTEFKGFIPSFAFNALNIEMFSCGSINTSTKEFEEIVSISDNNKIYKKLFSHEKILVGGILIGDLTKTVKLINSVSQRKTVHDAIDILEN